MPAFEAGIKEQQAEIETIANNAETPTFQNTILPFDKSGETLDRVSNVFFNLNECLTNDEMIAIAEQVLPMLSKHGDAIMMNPKLFERIDYVYQHRNEMGLDDQQIRVVEKYHQDFVRNGAALPADADREGQDLVYVDQVGTFQNKGRDLAPVMSPHCLPTSKPN